MYYIIQMESIISSISFRYHFFWKVFGKESSILNIGGCMDLRKWFRAEGWGKGGEGTVGEVL